MNFLTWFIAAGLAINSLMPTESRALEPSEVLVIANRFAARSVGLAKYYMEKRKIPEDNLLILWVTDNETCKRDDYEKRVAAPVREFLKKETSNKIRCLVTLYGMPLKIAAPELSADEAKQLEILEGKRSSLEIRLQSPPDDKERKNLEQELEAVRKELQNIKRSNDKVASLDSELALVKKEDYPLNMWIPNPYYLGFKDMTLPVKRDDVLMVSRLDAPDSDVVKRIIDDSMKAEEKGLTGKAYFDARWPDPGNKPQSNYKLYDRSIHLAAALVKKNNIMPVVVNDSEELFKPNDCPDTAIYCGWYSLAKYVDSFRWLPGSVGYHIASGECSTLKKKESAVWCKRMLEQGASAVIGPVDEPYVDAFPLPEVFFGVLTDGYFTLAESYLISLPFISWKMVLIGDPLYRPFKNRPTPVKK